MYNKFLRLILISVITLTFSQVACAQSYVDNALLFSQTSLGGSARIQAIGGTQISLGGDFSSALSNPAGLGMYNRSEVTLSPAFNSYKTKTSYAGNSKTEFKSLLNIPSLSLVLHHDTGKEQGFMGGSLGISMTRINDFTQDYVYQGSNKQSSIIDYFKQSATGIDPSSMIIDNNGNIGDNFYNITSLAYNNYLIEDYNSNGQTLYDSKLDPLPEETIDGVFYPAEIRTVLQKESIIRKGAQNQWSIAYGGNFSDKFFFGGSIGVTALNYEISQVYTESNFSFDQSPDYHPLNNLRLEEKIRIKGSGVNLALGAIYRPVDMLQIGMSLVTPTYYQLTDKYNASLSTKWNNFDYYEDGSKILNDIYENFNDGPPDYLDAPVISKYSFSSPLKFNTGLTFISKYGFISGDIQLVNYARSKYSSEIDDYDYRSENDEIKSTYSSVLNYRFGGEFRHDIFRIRAGYNFMADPYSNGGNLNGKVTSISGGVGVRLKNYFFDLAVVNSNHKGKRIPYSANNVPDPVASIDYRNTNFIITAGFTF